MSEEEARGHLQDLTHSAKILLSQMKEAFPKEIQRAVEMGRLIDGIEGHIDFMPQWEAGVYVQLANDLADFQSYSEEQWDALQDQHLQAMVDWQMFCDPKTKPNKKWRVKQRLNGNPLADYVLVGLRRMANG